MKTLQDYIKLAESADDSACHVINAMAEKYPLGADFERYNEDIRKMIEFCSDERTVAMAKALIEAENALKTASLFISWCTDAAAANEESAQIQQALAQIQSLQENKNEQR